MTMEYRDVSDISPDETIRRMKEAIEEIRNEKNRPPHYVINEDVYEEEIRAAKREARKLMTD